MKKLTIGFISLLMAVTMTLCFVVSAGASDLRPVKLPNGKDIDATIFADFDSANTGFTVGQVYTTANYTNEVITSGGYSGSALKTNATKGEGYPAIIFDTPKDMTGYDGIMFYIDATGVTHGSVKNFGLGLRIFTTELTAVESTQSAESFAWIRNTQTTRFNDVDLSIYYYSECEWTKLTQSANPTNGERFNLPANFKGFVYFPFSSYISRKNTDAVQAGILGLDSVTKIGLSTNYYTYPSSFITDNYTLVKEAVAPDTTDETSETTDPSNPSTGSSDFRFTVIAVLSGVAVLSVTSAIVIKKKEKNTH